MLSTQPKSHMQESSHPSPTETHQPLRGIKQMFNNVKSGKKTV